MTMQIVFARICIEPIAVTWKYRAVLRVWLSN